MLINYVVFIFTVLLLFVVSLVLFNPFAKELDDELH